eukprot:1051884-Rhodomonas_salina.4
MSGTELVSGTTSSRMVLSMSGTELAYGATRLRMRWRRRTKRTKSWYATEIAYGAYAVCGTERWVYLYQLNAELASAEAKLSQQVLASYAQSDRMLRCYLPRVCYAMSGINMPCAATSSYALPMLCPILKYRMLL